MARLREEIDGDISVLGSGALVRVLLAAGLLDGLVLQTFPIALGSGTTLFADGERVDMELTRSVSTSGVLLAENSMGTAPTRALHSGRSGRQVGPGGSTT